VSGNLHDVIHRLKVTGFNVLAEGPLGFIVNRLTAGGRAKMAPHVIEVLLWLFVVNLSITFGAGLYESRITVPQWLSFSPDSGYRWNAAAARQADVDTLSLSLLTVASLIAAWWAREPVRHWWLGAAAVALVERAMTGAYFIPTMVKLMQNQDLPESQAATKALQWMRLGYVRLAVVLVAWLAALKAFSLLYAQGS
jgi:hypothetical protein